MCPRRSTGIQHTEMSIKMIDIHSDIHTYVVEIITWQVDEKVRRHFDHNYNFIIINNRFMVDGTPTIVDNILRRCTKMKLK